ncbi:hypothetical protein DYB32_008297 [Aphanomyces invadans]|uniref:ODAD1 central coiled coil region domain-containing protein n=1 Tax=Aphanomyces invadans TaxID=157072 RepID=A0A3R6VS98_9STRA|nr:hypothetical protein DYB32_008297 [Aphanomyces invadans]
MQRHDSKSMLKRMEMDYDARMEEQVDDLREKMRLLQVDRKGNVELLETNKNSNKELIRQLKQENKELRKHAEAPTNGGLVVVAEGDDETSQVAVHLTKCRKQYDDDSVKDLELEAKKPSLEDTPETRKIRMLENRLDKAMIKYNEAQSIRKTYEQIVKRLKEERIGFDNQLAAIERAAAAKNHDYDELVMLSADAAHAKDLTVAELERVRSNYEEDRRLRDKELREKQQVVKMKLDMNARLDRRERQKHEIVEAEVEGLAPDEGHVLKTSLALNSLKEGRVADEKKEHRSKIDIFESAFRKIKEATGVSDVNEVIQKIVSQEGTTENLMMLSKENQARLEALQAEHLHLKTHVEELKYSGSGGGHRRKMVDDHETNLNLATAKLERARVKFERVAKILISVKAGVEHLVDKIESLTETAVPADAGPSTSLSASASTSTAAAAVVSDDELAVGITRPYNQRIPLPGDGFLADELNDDDGLLLEENDDALSRDRVKKASKQVLLDQDKRKKRVQKKVSVQDMDDFTADDAMASATALGMPTTPAKKK